jgi:hypothetical protein
MHRFLNEAQINNIDLCARCMHACDCSGSNSNGWSGEEGWICDLHDAHGQGGPAFRIARLLEQPLVGDHIVRPLRVHIQRVPAQANACVPSGLRRKKTIPRRPVDHGKTPIPRRRRRPRSAAIERLTGRGGGGSGPRARPRRPERPRRRSAGGRAPRCTPRGVGRACPSAARPRRPRTAVAAVTPAGDYPRPWICQRGRLRVGARRIASIEKRRARDGRAATTALAWEVVART